MKKRNVFNKIFTAFWVLIVPYMLYEIVNQFVVIWQDFKEGDLNFMPLGATPFDIPEYTRKIRQPDKQVAHCPDNNHGSRRICI